MPNLPDVRPTSHDRHDPLLVAALAAGDLAATDRDHATSLIGSCPDCAILHDDLVAIARATASVPPPIANRPRDFRLSPEQAARLRPAGWRRLAAAFAGPRLAFARPLGIGLTTIGLAGLLLGNLTLGFGSAASAPAAGGATSESVQTTGSSGRNSAAFDQASPAASGAYPAAAPAASAAAASAVPVALGPAPSASANAGYGTSADTAGEAAASAKAEASRLAAIPRTAAGSPGGSGAATDQSPPGPSGQTIAFAAAIVVGLGLIAARRVARRVIAA
jgi:hypothetical protein